MTSVAVFNVRACDCLAVACSHIVGYDWINVEGGHANDACASRKRHDEEPGNDRTPDRACHGVLLAYSRSELAVGGKYSERAPAVNFFLERRAS
jgi:hypothetical protein